jgi:hypothetical protein
MNTEHDIAAAIAMERAAFQCFRSFLEENRDLLSIVAAQGDGECGELLEVMKRILLDQHGKPVVTYRKKKISASLRTAVFERDMYRCRICADHRDLCADHIHPESLGGATSFENLQTLCRSCNSTKGAKVEFAA